MVPGGARRLLQPVDAGIGKLVKDKAKKEYAIYCMKNFEEIIIHTWRRKNLRKLTNKEVASSFIDYEEGFLHPYAEEEEQKDQ